MASNVWDTSIDAMPGGHGFTSLWGGSGDSADVTKMKNAGMTSEYLAGTNDAYYKKYGRNMSGDVTDKMKGDRAFGDEFNRLVSMSNEELLRHYASSEERQKLINYGLLTPSEVEKWDAKEQASAKQNLPPEMQALLDRYGGLMEQRPEFDPSMAEKWLPYLQKISDPLVANEDKAMRQYMNDKGLLNSGQTVSNYADIATKYGTQNYNTALGYAKSDYDTQLKQIEDAANKYMGILNTGMQRNWNISDALLNRAYDTEDWLKQASLATNLGQMQVNAYNKNDDWTKYLQPIATIGGAMI